MKKNTPKKPLKKIVTAFCIKPEHLEKIERIAVDFPFDGKRSRVIQAMIAAYKERNAK
jgi:hypothetical protein